MARYMLIMKPGVESDAWQPDVDIVTEMTKFNEAMVSAGVMLAGDGLAPPDTAKRISVRGGEKVVTDGPFAESKEVIGGYWIIQAKSDDEALEWAKRVPLGPGPEVELRRIMELEDFPEDVQEAGRLSQEPPEQTREG